MPVVFASSIQATLDNPYGRSKRAAEQELLRHAGETGSPVYRFPPAQRVRQVVPAQLQLGGRDLLPQHRARPADHASTIPPPPLRLVYVDDVVARVHAAPRRPRCETGFVEAGPVYATTVGELAEILRGFAESRATLVTARVGTGLVRALYCDLRQLPAAGRASPTRCRVMATRAACSSKC